MNNNNNSDCKYPLASPAELKMVDTNLLAPFLITLYRIACSENTGITWRDNVTFTVDDPPSFTNLLAAHFAHGKFKSFVRQLNNFSFSKVGGPADASGPCTFQHKDKYFVWGAPELLCKIKRKLQKRNRRVLTRPRVRVSVPPLTTERVTDMRVEVETLKRRRAEYEKEVTKAKSTYKHMKNRVAELEETAQMLKKEIATDRAEHSALMVAMHDLMSLVPAPFQNAIGGSYEAAMSAPTPERAPLAYALQATTLDMILGGYSPREQGVDCDPFPSMRALAATSRPLNPLQVLPHETAIDQRSAKRAKHLTTHSISPSSPDSNSLAFGKAHNFQIPLWATP